MRHDLVRLAVLAAGVTALAGCARGDEAGVSRDAGGDCVRAWNDAGNEENRELAARELRGWSLEVSPAHALRAQEGLTRRGCAYFFYSSSRWTSFRGMWETDGDLRWGIPPSASGSMSGARGTRSPNAILRADGTIARLP